MIKFKKFQIIIALVLLIAVAGGSFYFINNSKETDHASPQSAAPSTSRSSEAKSAPPGPAKTPVDACEKLTLADAKKIIGEDAQIVNSEDSVPRETEHLKITTCTYKAGASTNAQSASLLVRVAKSAEGSSQDKAQFGPNRPANARNVPGFGDAAYWNADFAELHILKGSTWYILTVGPQNASERKMEDAIKMAELLNHKL